MLSNKKYINKKTFVSNGLVGAWDFSNGSSGYIYDQSGYGNNAQSGGQTSDSIISWGKNSKSISLNGDNNYFEVTGEQIPDCLNLKNSLAFCAWIKFKSKINGAVIAGNLSDGEGWVLSTLLKDEDLKLKFRSRSSYYVEAVSEFSLPLDYWVFVSVVHEINDYIKFYLNGNEKKSVYYPTFGSQCAGVFNIFIKYESVIGLNPLFLSGESINFVQIETNSKIKTSGVSEVNQYHNVDFHNSDYYFYDHLDFYYTHDPEHSYDEYSLKLPDFNRQAASGLVISGQATA